MNEDYGHGRQEQQRPLRKSAAGNQDLATVADRAFNFTLFEVLDSDRLSSSGNYHAGDNRFSFATSRRRLLGLSNRLAAWSILLRAFRGILHKRVESEIESTSRTGKGLDHLVEFYRLSQGRHRG